MREKYRSVRREEKLRHIKNLFQKYLMEKIIHHINQEQKKIIYFFAQEEQTDLNLVNQHEEDKKKDLELKGKLNLNQHYKKHPEKDRRKCWNCKSTHHLKKTCPGIGCFFLQKVWTSKKRLLQEKSKLYI